MRTIHLLSAEIVALIAAGEVIERPSFAVKELIDNAIDAGASQIFVDLKDAGLSSIVVDDNGQGMSPEDVQVAWKLHTTSKIKNADELRKVTSLGFRGEALASIAATCTLTIRSKKVTAPLGYEICVQNQKVIKEGNVGMPSGTRIIVEDFFATVPARQKFLKKPTTELRTIIDMVSGFVIAHPMVRFVLKNNGKSVIEFPTALSFKERLSDFLQEEAFSQYIPVKIQESYVTVEGYIGHPSQAMSTNSHQYSVVNHRRIVNSFIAEAVRDAVRELLPEKQYLPFFLYLTIPPELIDVNVHPRKELVEFVSASTVYSAIQEAIHQALLSNDLTFQSTLSGLKASGPLTTSIAGKFLKSSVLKEQAFTKDVTHLTQYHLTYIIGESLEGIFFVDQHAAHERILYEKFLHTFLMERKKNKTVPMQVSMHFSKSQQLIIEEYRVKLSELGFTFNSNYMLTTAPALFSDREVLPIIEELLSDLAKDQTVHATDSLTHSMLTYLACRSAVKAGDALTMSEMKKILKELEASPNKFTCPHGRPTMIQVPVSDLHKLFKRQ